MSDFEFNLEKELAGIRGRTDPPKEPPKQAAQPKPARKPEPDAHRKNVKQGQAQHHETGGSTAAPAAKPPESEPEGFGVKQSQQETPGNSGQPKNPDDPVGWKQFKTLSGIFEYVGGARPVRLNPKIRKAQVSGVPEPMLGAIQEHLKEKYLGASIEFPWGLYTITDKNRVFNSNPSLLRYLLFDSFRDADGTHVQYAKQWLALQYPAFDEAFRPETHMQSGDELDIYALLVLGHSSGDYGEQQTAAQSEQDHQTADKLNMINISMSRLMDKMNEQQEALEAQNRQNSMVQTVLLLDRLGLLKGGLPKDIGAFVRVLEQNRDAIAQTGVIVGNHIKAEEERQKTLARQARIQQMQQRR